MRSVAFAGFVIICALAAGCNIEADFSDSIEVVTLDADEYQVEIATIDRLLFTETPLGEEGVRSLSEKLASLAKRVGEGTDSKFLKAESLELRLLSEKSKRLSPKGNGARFQNDWMRIRNNLFDDRVWFVRSAADLEYAASVVPLPEDEPVEETATEAAVDTMPTVAYDDRRNALEGEWRVVAMEVRGEPSADDELTNAIWTFQPPRLTMKSQAGNAENYTFTPESSDGREYLRVSKGAADGWMLYELSEGNLRVAFFDGLGGQPTSFAAGRTPSDPVLVVVHLRAIQ